MPPLCIRSSLILPCREPWTPDVCGNPKFGPFSSRSSIFALTERRSSRGSSSQQEMNWSVTSTSQLSISLSQTGHSQAGAKSGNRLNFRACFGLNIAVAASYVNPLGGGKGRGRAGEGQGNGRGTAGEGQGNSWGRAGEGGALLCAFSNEYVRFVRSEAFFWGGIGGFRVICPCGGGVRGGRGGCVGLFLRRPAGGFG